MDRELIFTKIKKARDAIFEIYYKDKLYRGGLYDEQIEMMDAIFWNTILGLTGDITNSKNIIINVSRQWGKSFTVFNSLVIILLFLPNLLGIKNFTVGLTVNKKDQVKKNYLEVKKYLNIICPDFGIEFNENNKGALEISNGSKIVLFSMEADHNQGETLHLSIVDESQDIDFDKYDKEILPMLSKTGGITVKLGVGGYKLNQYYKDILDTIKNIVFKFDYKKIIEIDDKMFKKFNDFRYNIYKQVVEKLNQFSASFQTEYELKWLIEIGNFIKLVELQQMKGNYRRIMRYDNPCWVGIDWAKTTDSTVVTVVGKIDGKIKILNWLKLEGIKYNIQTKDIVNFLKNYNVEKIYTDNTGVGGGVIDFLEEKLRPNIIERINFNETTKDLMYTNLNNIFEGKEFEYPTNSFTEEFEGELINLEKEFRKNGKMNCHHPDLPNQHDDFCDSLALSLLFTTIKEGDVYQIN